MRVIIAGGRDFNNYDLLESKCHKVFKMLSDKGLLSGCVEEDIKNIEIISGGATGADSLAVKFAKDYNIPITMFHAEWDKYRNNAGFIRNEKMAKYAKEDNGVLIAFWDNKSKGTKHMISSALRCGLTVEVEKY